MPDNFGCLNKSGNRSSAGFFKGTSSSFAYPCFFLLLLTFNWKIKDFCLIVSQLTVTDQSNF